MTTKLPLDTIVVSEPLRPQPSAGIMRRLRDHEGEMAIPALVWHELRIGCARLAHSRRRDAIERYLDEVVAVSFPVLDNDWRAADWHALERAAGCGGSNSTLRRWANCSDCARQRPDTRHLELG